MAETRRPRNIRDIAHLYLSRSPSTAESATLNLFLSAETRDCVPGFHAANLAAAIATRGARVRVFELSGLLPNTAYYFSHQPNFYLGSTNGHSREFSPGLNSISITFDSIRLMGESSDGLRVNLVHTPTVDDDRFAATLGQLRDCCPGERWALYLSRDSAQSREALFRDVLGVSEVFALRLPKANGSAAPLAVDQDDLGNIRRWEASVEDRLPIVVRNPNSGLAREYVALCESILARITTARRRNRAERANGKPASRPQRLGGA